MCTHTPFQCSSETNLNATGIHFIIYSLALNSSVNLILPTPALPTPSLILSSHNAFAPVMLKFSWSFSWVFFLIDLCQWKESIHLTVKFTPKKLYLIPYDRTEIVLLSRDSPQPQDTGTELTRTELAIPFLGAAPGLSSYLQWGAIVCFTCWLPAYLSPLGCVLRTQTLFC